MKKNTAMYSVTTNRILLGLLMLIPGLSKLFIMGADAVSGMLSGFGFPAPLFFAWVLIIAEIATGIAIIANFKIRLSVIPPIIIMVIAGILTFSPERIPSLIMHIVIASNYWVFGAYGDNK
ncbi:MAG: DoxX family protein [archaeon]|nr:DoxX family protein [archaeon]MCR4323555.1 DoxX family protein [Nanoarchaeota archaeon]